MSHYSYPIDHPTSPGFKSDDFSLVDNVAVNEGLTRVAGKVRTDGQRWTGTIDFPLMDGADAAAWEAFLAKLRGPWGTFKMGHPNRSSPRGSALGTPKIQSTSNGGNTLTIDGWDANETGLLLPADMIEINGDLLQVVDQVDSDGSGSSTVNVEHRLRADFNAGDSVITDDPKGTFRLQDNERQISADSLKMRSISIAVVEKVDV